MRKNKLLILFTCVTVFLSAMSSCTFDYFDDETNYQVFVPGVLDNSIDNCRVMIYNDAGELVGDRYAASPWTSNPRIATGFFSFALPPGKHKVHVYTNTDSVSFVDTKSLETSAFVLNKQGSADRYVQPSDISFQVLKPTIIHAGILVFDTAKVERYTGRITVRFKRFPADVSTISKVGLVVNGAATMQYLKHDTLTTQRSVNDVMFHIDKIAEQKDPAILEVDHRYLPFVDDGGRMKLEFSFLTSMGETVLNLPVEVAEKDTGIPLRLLYGRRMIIEVDTYALTNITIVDWDEDIQSGNTNME